MKKYKIFKTAPHIYGHIFEHVLARRMTNFTLENNLFFWLNTQIEAWTFDNIISFEVSRNIYKKLGFFIKNKITENEVLDALNDISCEYERKYSVKNIDQILEKVNKINEQKWLKMNETYSVKSFYEDDVLTAPGIAFSRKKSLKNFYDFEIFFSLPKEYFELRPLAAYVFFAINEYLSAKLTRDFYCYQRNEGWNEWNDYTELFFRFTVQKSRNFNEINSFVKNEIDNFIKDEKKIREILKYLKKTKNQEKYFTWFEMLKISRNMIGKNGWRKIATRENFAKVCENMKFECDINE